MNKNIIVAPSILSADFGYLQSEIKKIEQADADWIHIDVMDGHFVPNLSFGVPIVKSVRKMTNKVLDVHLMITNPEKYVEIYADAGADIICFHAEATRYNRGEVIEKILAKGKKPAVAINPDYDVRELLPYLDKLYMVLVMSVYPGFGGQKMIKSSLEKITFLNNYKKENKLNYLIEIDGGVNDKTIDEVAKTGVNAVVAGSYVFGAKDYEKAIKSLKKERNI